MNIFEMNKGKYEIKSRAGLATIGLSIMLTGGVMFLIGLPLSFIVIGIPFVIVGVLLMIVGGLMLLASPFYKVKAK